MTAYTDETLEQYRRAEHLCLRCGNCDDWTEEGHRLRRRCMLQEDEEMMVEKEKQKRDAKRAQRKAEHRCTSCWEQDERTLAGRIYCASCAEKQKAREARSAEKKRQEELRAVLEAYGYTVSLEDAQDDDWDIQPDKLRVMRKYGYRYNMMAGKWTVEQTA